MPNDYGSQDVICPYYKRHGTMNIDCEGYDEGSLNRQIFRNKECLKKHFDHCKSDWKNCPIADMLNKKWGV